FEPAGIRQLQVTWGNAPSAGARIRAIRRVGLDCVHPGERRHVLGYAERGGQTRRLDAEKIDEPGDSMNALGVDAKVRRLRLWTHDLGTHTRISGPQSPTRQL